MPAQLKNYLHNLLLNNLERSYEQSDRVFRAARIWSNGEICRFSQSFTGSVINVSAWLDEDKDGSHYKDYFPNAKSYQISNFKGTRGTTGKSNEIYIDLEDELPEEYHYAFDLVFNHTTLEHIFDVRKAFSNLCLLSKDCVMLIIPFLQEVHINDSYLDYWRFTPHGIRRLFNENEFEVVYESSTAIKNASVYLFYIAVKDKSKWNGRIMANFLPDSGVGRQLVSNTLSRTILGIALKILKRMVNIL